MYILEDVSGYGDVATMPYHQDFRMKDGSDREVIAWLEQEFSQSFEGWDFSYLDNRRIPMGSLPWDYGAIASDYLSRATSALDIDTGGGELFSELLRLSGFTGTAYAIEPYAPNVPIARNKLEKHRVKIRDTSQGSAGLEDASVDMVLSRHGGSVSPEEIRRLLSSGGYLVTQQVGDQTNQELRQLFGVEQELESSWPHNASDAEKTFSDLEFNLVRLESHSYQFRFSDVGALVYYLKAVPWEVPGFSVAKYADTLLGLHREVLSRGYAVDATNDSYFAVIRKR